MKLNPYLTFAGTCEEAFKAYEKIFGGEIMAMLSFGDMPVDAKVPAEWRKKIAHARLVLDGTLLMGSDASPEYRKPMQGFSVTLNIKAPAEAERVFKALAECGTTTMPLTETFWANKFGTVTDRFGTPWMINCEKDI